MPKEDTPRPDPGATHDRGGRAHDPERIADVREQLLAGSFRFTGENPANSSNDVSISDAALTDDSPCPACNEPGIWREEADVGIGIIYGPYGCQCGWSEHEEYDCRDGRKEAPASRPGWQADPWGGITSDERVAEDEAFFDFLESVAARGPS